MIFYFTGTGNSLYVARKLAAPGETVRIQGHYVNPVLKG